MKYTKGTIVYITCKDGTNVNVSLDHERELKTGDIFTWNPNKHIHEILQVTNVDSPICLFCNAMED